MYTYKLQYNWLKRSNEIIDREELKSIRLIWNSDYVEHNKT